MAHERVNLKLDTAGARRERETPSVEDGNAASYADLPTIFRLLDVGNVFRIYKMGETALRQKISTRSYVDYLDGPNGSRKTIKAATPVKIVHL